MNTAAAILVLLVALLLVLAGITRIGAWSIERRHPPAGAFETVNDTVMHHVHVPGPERPSLPPVVFIHGASGNLKDQMLPMRPLLEGKAQTLFVDRPGHGWSGRGPTSNATPHGQARTIAALMERLGIDRAVIIGHSFGGAVAATFALDHPEKTAGLVFVSAASHPWPGADTSWYYRLATIPVIGRLFSETLALPGGLLRMNGATDCVFAPNRAPPDYAAQTSIGLVLHPRRFRHNAVDVEGLYDHVVDAAPRYGAIAAPTVVISGDSDTVVYEEIHSVGLARDISGAKMVWVPNLGHKPDWVAPELLVAAIGHVAGAADGNTGDLDAVAQAVAARIANDAYGPVERCRNTKPPAVAAAAGR